MLDEAEAARVVHEQRQRRKRRQRRRQHHRACAGPAAAMRRREGLVQVDMHGVDAEIARPHAARDRVEIGAVAIEIGARLVHRIGDLHDAPLEQAAGVGIGQHDGGDIGTELRLQRIGIDMAVVLRRHFVDREAGKRGGRRIGAVRR